MKHKYIDTVNSQHLSLAAHKTIVHTIKKNAYVRHKLWIHKLLLFPVRAATKKRQKICRTRYTKENALKLVIPLIKHQPIEKEKKP